MQNKLPISAIVVGLNEAHLLERGLPQLAFCDEILYFDLGSIDDSNELAQAAGAQVITHKRVDSCEWIHEAYATTTKHHWVLITDPDEIISDELITNLHHIFKNTDKLNDVGAITAPWVFYFKNRRLKGTNWGGINSRILLVHNQRFIFRGLIHLGRKIQDGYLEYKIPYNGKNVIHHYWMVSYRKLLDKHVRYLRHEGKARYINGLRANLRTIIYQPFRSFRYSFFSAKGYKDGFTGLVLSLFWAWYETNAKIQNYRYQKRIESVDRV